MTWRDFLSNLSFDCLSLSCWAVLAFLYFIKILTLINEQDKTLTQQQTELSGQSCSVHSLHSVHLNAEDVCQAGPGGVRQPVGGAMVTDRGVQVQVVLQIGAEVGAVRGGAVVSPPDRN